MLTELEILEQNRLEKICKYLYQIRQEQGISLKAIAQQTRFQKHQLRAIEQGNLDTLPPSVYIQKSWAQVEFQFMPQIHSMSPSNSC